MKKKKKEDRKITEADKNEQDIDKVKELTKNEESKTTDTTDLLKKKIRSMRRLKADRLELA